MWAELFWPIGMLSIMPRPDDPTANNLFILKKKSFLRLVWVEPMISLSKYKTLTITSTDKERWIKYLILIVFFTWEIFYMKLSQHYFFSNNFFGKSSHFKESVKISWNFIIMTVYMVILADDCVAWDPSALLCPGFTKPLNYMWHLQRLNIFPFQLYQNSDSFFNCISFHFFLAGRQRALKERERAGAYWWSLSYLSFLFL